MELNRKVFQDLNDWKDSPDRKPLILQGARQVGKTWLLKKFGATCFADTAYFNFDQQNEIKQFFQVTKDPKRILENLSLVHGKAIMSESTLIILDEIQECKEALNAMKYFCEDAPEYAIACAGSLLGVAMKRGASFPVGKVDFIKVFPLTFSEFLEAAEPVLFAYLNNLERIEPIPDIFYNQLKDKLKLYFITGGMPESVASFLDRRDVGKVQTILLDILNSYSLDFSKHVDIKDIAKISHVWGSLPSQLARENKKFLYQTIRVGARAREYEDAITWLINAGLYYKTYCSTKPGLPLSAYDDLSAFKIYFLDTGLLRRLSLLDPSAIAEGNRLLTEFKGALTENYVLNSLIQQFEGMPRYWKSGNEAEVDFIIQYQNQVIPVEVKSDENSRSKSLTVYRKSFKPEISIKYSLLNLRRDQDLINIPLFLADFTSNILQKI